MKTDDRIPGWMWRGVLALLSGAVLMTIALLAATLAGVADPRPLGALMVNDAFVQPSQWRLTLNDNEVASPPLKDGRLEIPVSAGGGQLFGLSPDQFSRPCTIELRAEQIGGGHDARYGLWLGDTAGQPAILAGANSDGYLGVLQATAPAGQPIMDWQIFPHVRPSGQINAFRADIDLHQVTIRLNDEVAARFPWDVGERISAGLFIQASVHDNAVIRFLSFKVWETNAANP